MSSRVTVWSVLFLGFFIAIYLVYDRYTAFRDAMDELDRPVVSEISTRYFKAKTPPGWKVWGTDGDSAVMYRGEGDELPYIDVFVRRVPSLAYAALDINKSLLIHHIHERVARHGLVNTNFTQVVVELLGSETVAVKPGVPAERMIIDVGPYEGQAIAFLMADVAYVVVGVIRDEDDEGRRTIDNYIRHVSEMLTLPDARESIERAVIDSSNISSEVTAEMLAKSGRELAMWKLFAARVDQEPEAALLPAITHFREAIKALSSIRREYQILNTPDFKQYRRFLQIRKKNVNEWFVQFDKLMAMNDIEGARNQARFIIDHATLVDESLDRRRASEKLATLVAKEGK